jgi:hypothetical protein
VVEVPIRWVEAEGTTVRPVRDPLIMIRDLLRTRRRCRQLERVTGRFVWETSEPGIDTDRVVELAGLEPRTELSGSSTREMLAELPDSPTG